jgi:SWI/SNF-related matrix-associated actin-dependent regulator of chromatin subfamily A3
MQAVDRVHRLGQTRPVETIRLVIKGSIEEHILEMQKEKADLAREALLDEGGSKISRKGTREMKKKMRLQDLQFLLRNNLGNGESAIDQ